MDLKCLKDPPPFITQKTTSICSPFCQEKSHLLVMHVVRKVSVILALCLECNLMFHKDCIYLPRIISINRHDHRISRTSHLGPGDWKCGVCRQKISCSQGAFICSRCPKYAFHLNCAIKDDVWDGKEFEDESEEESEDESNEESEDESEKKTEDEPDEEPEDESEEEIEEPYVTNEK